MPLTRKFLAALGIETDKVDEIIAQHAEVTDALKAEIKRYKDDAEKLPGVQKELDEYKKNAENSKDKDYDALRQEYEDYKKSVLAEKTQAEKEKAYRDVLKDARLSEKGIEKAVKYASWDKIELEDGKIKDAKNHIKAAKEEWADYVQTENTNGSKTANPPEGNGSGNQPSRAAAAAARYYAAIYGEQKSEGEKK